MKKVSVLWTFTLALLMMLPQITLAEETQNPLKMEELTIQVLPEYSYHPKEEDKNIPPLLVGYHGSLLNTTKEPLKGKVEIPLPTKEKNFRLGFVADYSADLREMTEIEYELDEQNGIISWETSREIEPDEMYKFVIEYYTDSIQVSKENKTLEYSFTSFAEIGMMNLIFVEPLKTESFKLEPAAETHQKNSYNMNMFLFQETAMKAGVEKKIKLVYERQDDRTTSEIMEEMAGENGQQAATKKNEEEIPTWMIVSVVGGVTIVVSALLLILLKKRTKKADRKQTPNGKREDEDVEIKKAKLRKMLVEGTITEEEYNILIKGLGGK